MDSKFLSNLQKVSSMSKITSYLDSTPARIKDLPLNEYPTENSFVVIDSEEEGTTKTPLPKINGVLLTGNTTLEDLNVPSTENIHSIPAGGKTNQVLRKLSDNDYETDWTDLPEGEKAERLSREDIDNIYANM